MVGIPQKIQENAVHPSISIGSSMNNAFEFAHQNLGIAAKRQSYYYDKGLNREGLGLAVVFT